jgi:hypothetical protein
MVEKKKSPPWAREEIILALDVFVRGGSLRGGPLPDDEAPEIVELSAVMQSLATFPPEVRASNFRNPSGVALKMANFRAIERAVAIDRGDPDAESLPKGMAAYSVLDRLVFEEFEGEWARLEAEAMTIRASAGATFVSAGERTVTDVDVEASLSGTYETSATSPAKRTRSEAELVLRFASWMSDRGREVIARHYRVSGEPRPLRCDALVKGIPLLVEAKSTDDRAALRMAVGQLYDYRRFEAPATELAVLLPMKPAADRLALLESADISCIWRRGDRFTDSASGRFTS